MADTNEWWDLHPTPRGWEQGSEKLDFGEQTAVPPPADRVKTLRYHERGSRWAIDRWLSQVWLGDDKDALERLEMRYGTRPPGDTYQHVPLR